ncbi:MAG: hypothetical protein KF774_06355 [Planctomyces sp.]|nr:hypothetical protein [Planctomyces sp.]
MILADLLLGSRQWAPWAVVAMTAGLALMAWSYLRAEGPLWVRLTAAGLRAIALCALAACLVEPLWTGTRPRPGSNVFIIAADNSRSLQLSDGARGSRTRGQLLAEALGESGDWSTRLGQDFDVRRYRFDAGLAPVRSFDGALDFEGQASSIAGALTSLRERFRDQPVAGILLLTDGNATDSDALPASWDGMPPVYPVALGDDRGLVDLAVSRVTVSQTNFDAAPVTLVAELNGRGLADRKVVLRVLEDGKEVERRTINRIDEGQAHSERFLLRPERAGVSFFSVQARLEGEDVAKDTTLEATLANNSRWAVVDRGGGPYRVLYVSGRPNWEFKFLRRALAEDDEVRLTGLIRIARKEPRFAFLGRAGERTNPLFRGFDAEEEAAEQYDEPVLIRLTDDPEELRGGFPKAAEELYRYHAIVLDDMEAAFFTQDQMSLVQQFVGRRGGGLLMLGGKESFAEGGFQRTPIGELLPVYLDRPESAVADRYRLKLTREGWLQPWVRVRTTEPDEEQRLADMPSFRTANRISAIKPGATVLSEIEGRDGTAFPALVVQSFGRGQSAALLIGDLWRWDLRREEVSQSDLGKAWRQTIRWLVSDVPKSVEVDARTVAGGSLPAVELGVRVRDPKFEPLDNAAVAVQVQLPDKRTVELTAEPDGRTAGLYRTTFLPRDPGVYKASIQALADDGSEVGRREVGWAVEPETEEFASLAPNRALLEDIASRTGGEMLSLGDLDAFVSGLPNRKIPITESWTYPLWHRWGVFALVAMCLLLEWGLRRWKGLP